MRATLLLAASAAGVFAMSAIAQTQDMQMAPAQGSAVQQSTQDSSTATNDSSYGGAMSTSKSGSASRDAWTGGTMQLCTPGLSCNIYSGQ
ncbi:hypothetical protein AWB76_03842 [Caballeronia temeraria]|uniref:Lipoprotein n=1 Tax=Caballeronia temeraria TaxID=1777137 RepID=A0A158B9N7_9BURK|nr:hypothetical protein [Caballeronia temeraria]SAK66486.1 hypothetical protein AWB76_03842 [Caballeronia temeraria]